MRHGGFQCLGIPGALRAGLLYDFNADLCPNAAGLVTGNWVDSKGGLIGQCTAGTVYVPNAVQGHGAVRFNGSTQQLATTTGPSKSQPYHLWAVYKVITWVNNGVVASWVTSGGANAFGANGSTPGMGLYADTAWSGSDTHVAVGSYGIMQCIFNGASSSITNYGASSVGVPTSSTPGGSNPSGKIYMGAFNGASFLNCEVARLLIYDPSVAGYSAPLEGNDLVLSYLR